MTPLWVNFEQISHCSGISTVDIENGSPGWET